MNNTIETITNNQTIKQANVLVQAKYSLSALATDLLSLMLSEILHEHKELPMFKFRYVDIKNKMDKHVKWTSLIEAAKELTKCELEIELQDNIILSHWCSFCRYSKNGERTLELNIDPGLQKFLIDFSSDTTFTISYFNVTAKLRSTYSKRLYTMLMQFANSKNTNKYFIVKVDRFKDILQVSDKYKKYSDLKRFVIDIAMRQINEISEEAGIKVSLEEIKKGKRVDIIKFNIQTIKKASSSKKSYQSKGTANAMDSLSEWLQSDQEPIEAEVIPAIAS